MVQQQLNRIKYIYGMALVEGAYQGTTDDRMGRWYWVDMHSSVVDRRGRGFASKEEAVHDWLTQEEQGLVVARYILTHAEWSNEPLAFGCLDSLQVAVVGMFGEVGWCEAPRLDEDGEHIYYFDREREERVYVGKVEGGQHVDCTR